MMSSTFSFDLPTRIVFSDNLLPRTGQWIKESIPGRKVLVITDAGIRAVGLLEPVLASLAEEGYETLIFDQVAANPKDVDCQAGGELAREWNPDIILALGGGSVIDSAKAIALLHTHPGALRQYEGRGKVTGNVTPIVAIPTTAGTGSEVTRSSVITDTERRFKMTVKDGKLAPTLALVDPVTTYTLPPALTAATGMDAFVHAIEAYTCKLANPISDGLALAAMERIWRHLPVAVHDGSNQEARRQMMIGSLMAGMAFSHADVAAVHGMAEALGGLYDTPHGVANSMFLPYVTAFNAPADPVKHARVARICGVADANTSDVEATNLLVQALFKMADEIRIPRFSSLSYVRSEDFAALAEASYQNGSTPSNCRPIAVEDYRELLETAYAGRLPMGQS